jgi:hypothetical protein
MKKFAAILVACAAVSAAAVPMDFKDKMKEGLYEITTSVDASGIQGMPQGMKIPSTTLQRCVSREDIDKGGQAIVAEQGPRGHMPKDCQVQDFNLSGDTATYKMVCTGQKAMTLNGTITFTGTGYRGSNILAMDQGGKQMNMAINFESRYLGPCK